MFISGSVKFGTDQTFIIISAPICMRHMLPLIYDLLCAYLYLYNYIGSRQRVVCSFNPFICFHGFFLFVPALRECRHVVCLSWFVL